MTADCTETCEKRSLQFPHLSTAFEDEIVSFGPNDFFVMQKAADKAANTPPLKSVLSLMKLSGWDPDVFYKFRNVLSNQSPTASAELKQDVKHGISLVWSNYYALDNEKDIAFEIGRLCYNLHEYDSALAYYAISVWDTGKHYITSHNMGLCHYSKKQLVLAATCFEEAFALNNSYQKASIWLQRVRQEIGAVLHGGACAVPTQPAMQHLTDIVVHEQALQPSQSMLA
uniref:Uncharacterized protein n=1 Tax=Hyaloperonospora arabidopsidis (strain Emoy2) TaxID=559515 RepID=M4C1T8_HYAAE